jgi:transposase
MDSLAAYSIDLRHKSLRACEQHLASQRTIAHLFGVSRAFVEKMLRQHRATGDVAPKPPAGGQKPRLDPAGQAIIGRLVDDHPEATLAALCPDVATATGVRPSVPPMCRLRQRLGVPRQKSRSPPARKTPSASNRRGPATRRRSPGAMPSA